MPTTSLIGIGESTQSVFGKVTTASSACQQHGLGAATFDPNLANNTVTLVTKSGAGK